MYFYSRRKNSFYPSELIEIYKESRSLPDDIVEVDNNVWQEFAAMPAPEGKVRIAGKDGLPAWSDIPLPTEEELIRQAQKQKQLLLTEAAHLMAPLQDAVDLGMATEEETNTLNAWKQYRVQLNRIDTSTTPDTDWPEKPE